MLPVLLLSSIGAKILNKFKKKTCFFLEIDFFFCGNKIILL